MLQIRTACPQDQPRILEIYQSARELMQRTGNPSQWGTAFPPKELIQRDIEQQRSIVVFEGEKIHGVCAVCAGDEPTYQVIENGAWLDDAPYVTLHRVAGDGVAHGIFQALVDHCKAHWDNLRIDTHADNQIMQRLIQKNSFQTCGTIYVADGTPRIAYQWKKGAEEKTLCQNEKTF